VTVDRPAWLDAGQMSPLDDKLGIRITDFDPDHVVATMPVEGNQQPFGLLHGGASAVLAETLGFGAAFGLTGAVLVLGLVAWTFAPETLPSRQAGTPTPIKAPTT